MFANVPQEVIAGVFTSSIGLATFVMAQYEWYWEVMFSGYWKQWDTPAGRTYSKYVSAAVFVFGIALATGLLK